MISIDLLLASPECTNHSSARGANPQNEEALQAEIDESARSTLYSVASYPFEKPKSGKIAVKVINHYEDDVSKVFEV